MLKPIIDTVTTLGEELILVGVKAHYMREDKEKGVFVKTETIDGWDYEVVCLSRRFEKVFVRTEETRPLFDPKEEIPENTLVSFENMIITPWVRNGWIQLSIKASKCVIEED